MRHFRPLVRNPHLATIAAAFWPRRLNERRYPVEARLLESEPGVRVLVHTQRPRKAAGDVVLVHGLEGSSESPYMRSMAQTLLDAGYTVHRFNLRTCGGTEFLCRTLYHGGLTSDLFAWLTELDRLRRTPAFLCGFSLGGNIALKLAGELGGNAKRLLAGVCAVSVPLDLAACARRIGETSNRIYEWHFLRRMRQRLELRSKVLDRKWDAAGIRSLWDFDDRITARAFGFEGAADYYGTQSSARFLDAIRVPALVIQAIDDPLIPFSVFRHPAFESNPLLTLAAVENGGHVGFLSREAPRFWLDEAVREWIEEGLGG